jgi:hypothetical protein
MTTPALERTITRRSNPVIKSLCNVNAFLTTAEVRWFARPTCYCPGTLAGFVMFSEEIFLTLRGTHECVYERSTALQY